MKNAEEAIAICSAPDCGIPHGENTIYRSFDFRYDARDLYASMMKEEYGWKEYFAAQDMAFTNEKERLLFSFCEGDIALTVCPSGAAFKAELARWDSFYGVPK